ncbi:hypothetical protein [Longimicrobium sp.]|uniref:hypothetical protein n=1 Tax=Longimicrobium sp. TaxID=2029185 RepID=UPI003B3B4F2B
MIRPAMAVAPVRMDGQMPLAHPPLESGGADGKNPRPCWHPAGLGPLVAQMVQIHSTA